MEKIIELETRIAYFEDLVEQLSREIYKQSKKIESQDKIIERLSSRLNSIYDAMGEEIENRRPPHY